MDTKSKKSKLGMYIFIIVPAVLAAFALTTWTGMYDVVIMRYGSGQTAVQVRYGSYAVNSIIGFFGWRYVILAFLLAVIFFAAIMIAFRKAETSLPIELCLAAAGLWLWQAVPGVNIYSVLEVVLQAAGIYDAYGIIVFLAALPLAYFFFSCLAGLILTTVHGEFRKNSLLCRFVAAITHRKSIRAKLFAELMVAAVIGAAVSAGIVFAFGLPNYVVWITALFPTTLFLPTACMFMLGKHSTAGEMELIARQMNKMAQGEYAGDNPLGERAMLYGTGEALVSIANATRDGIEKGIAGEKLKVELISNVSHDLRTPLTAIIGYGEELAAMELPDVARERIDKLNHKSFYLKTMVDDLFGLSKAQAGAAAFTISELDVCRLMEQTLGLLDERIRSSGFDIRRSYPDGPVIIESDGHRLHRVFQNLIDNALKYSLAGTRIYISVTTDEECVTVSVLNTSAYDMSNCSVDLTERFTRGDNARSGEGSGIGLAIAKTYIEALGGTFNVYVRGDQFEAVAKMARSGEKE